MSDRKDIFVETVLADRERWVQRLMQERALFRMAQVARPRRHSLRELAGYWLIEAGRALLRHEPAYAAARRRTA